MSLNGANALRVVAECEPPLWTRRNDVFECRPRDLRTMSLCGYKKAVY
jgi:hypothetical protein